MTLWDKTRNVFRISYTLPFVFAAMTGVVFAWTVRSEWVIGALILLDVFLLALFVNISNDYFDHRSGADQDRWKRYNTAEEKDLREMFNEKFYWTGNAFDRGIVSDRTGKIIIIILAVLAGSFAIPILMFGGIIVLIMGGVAFFLSYFYTAPPLNLGARGFGEIDVGLSFTLISLFAYLVIVPTFSWEMLIIALTVGICVMLMRVVDQMSGYEAHLAAGEKDFSVRFGQMGAARITLAMLMVVYALDLVLVLFFDLAFVLLFLTMPLALRLRNGFNDQNDRYRWIRHVPNMLKIATGQEILIVISLATITILGGTVRLF